MRKTKAFILSLVLILLPSFSWAWSGEVVGITDGDTITVLRDKEQVRIRLYGIDCPEGGQHSAKGQSNSLQRRFMGKWLR